MSSPLPPAKLVSLKNSCFICPEEDFNTPQNLRKHVLRFHDLQMPSRDVRMKHKDTNEIMYISQKLNHPNVKLHLACPSCLYSSELKKTLRNTLKPSTIVVKEIAMTLNQRITKKKLALIIYLSPLHETSLHSQ